MAIKQPQIVMEEVNDPVELEQARAQDARFARQPEASAGGTKAASFSSHSSGESLMPVVPSDQGCVKV